MIHSQQMINSYDQFCVKIGKFHETLKYNGVTFKLEKYLIIFRNSRDILV